MEYEIAITPICFEKSLSLLATMPRTARRLDWEFHLVLVQLCFMSWVASTRAEEPALIIPVMAQSNWIVSRARQAVARLVIFHFCRIFGDRLTSTYSAYACLSQPHRAVLRFLRIALSNQGAEASVTVHLFSKAL